MPVNMLGLSDICRAANLNMDRVRNWRTAAIDFPEPDVIVAKQYHGWHPRRLPEILAWLEAELSRKDTRYMNHTRK